MKKYIYSLIFCLLLTFFLIPDGWCISDIKAENIEAANIFGFLVVLLLLFILFILSLFNKISWRWLLSIMYFFTANGAIGFIKTCLKMDGAEVEMQEWLLIFILINCVCGIWCLFPSSKKHLKKIFLIWLILISLCIGFNLIFKESLCKTPAHTTCCSNIS